MARHVMRREEGVCGNTVMLVDVPGKSRKGRPKRMWMDGITHDLAQD